MQLLMPPDWIPLIFWDVGVGTGFFNGGPLWMVGGSAAVFIVWPDVEPLWFIPCTAAHHHGPDSDGWLFPLVLFLCQ